MPELAEVEFNRRTWDSGMGKKILKLRIHPKVRIFRDVKVGALEKTLTGSTLSRSEARGKQIIFLFSGGNWLGIHLGMTGRLRVEGPNFEPAKHDHLVLYQSHRALVFMDMRQFGRVRFHQGTAAPAWWRQIPPSVTSSEFGFDFMRQFLLRHKKLPIKATLLQQKGFPGIGNWMADEILWRAGIDPRLRTGKISGVDLRKLWQKLRWVAREAMRWVSPTYSEFPRGWLFHERWNKDGKCPRHRIPLRRETVGGRTTAWCPQCQQT